MSLDIFLAPGETLDVTAVLRNHAGGVVVQRIVDSWTSSDQTKATVTKTGDRTARITGVASSGTCTIRAFLTSGPGSPLSSSVCTVHCQAAPVDPTAPHAILLSLSSVPLGDGETVDITATILDQNGNVVPGRAIDSWTTADGTIATVASTGGLTARVTGHGTSGNPTNIIAHITSGSGSPLASDPLIVSNRGAGITATGGTITDVDGCRVHTFTAGGTFQITAGAGDVEILVVGGGGSGADINGTGVGGGGGGGGEVVHLTQHLGVGSYAVAVGAGAPHGLGTAGQEGQTGSDSTFNGSSLLTARGGGGGGCFTPRTGHDGGCGGGAAGTLGRGVDAQRRRVDVRRSWCRLRRRRLGSEWRHGSRWWWWWRWRSRRTRLRGRPRRRRLLLLDQRHPHGVRQGRQGRPVVIRPEWWCCGRRWRSEHRRRWRWWWPRDWRPRRRWRLWRRHRPLRTPDRHLRRRLERRNRWYGHGHRRLARPHVHRRRRFHPHRW
jgi:hypothetical protein